MDWTSILLHVRSKREERQVDVIVTHGWPGSVIEQMKIIDPLTESHGTWAGSASDRFHLVIPSLPGYGFSGKPTAPSWNPVSIAQGVGDSLCKRLGYTKYVAQGGDWGNSISEGDGSANSRLVCSAFTPTWRQRFLPDVFEGARGRWSTARRASRLRNNTRGINSIDFYKNGVGYARRDGATALRPCTDWLILQLALAAWMIDHDIRSYYIDRSLRSTASRKGCRRTMSSTTSRSTG